MESNVDVFADLLKISEGVNKDKKYEAYQGQLTIVHDGKGTTYTTLARDMNMEDLARVQSGQSLFACASKITVHYVRNKSNVPLKLEMHTSDMNKVDHPMLIPPKYKHNCLQPVAEIDLKSTVPDNQTLILGASLPAVEQELRVTKEKRQGQYRLFNVGGDTYNFVSDIFASGRQEMHKSKPDAAEVPVIILQITDRVGGDGLNESEQEVLRTYRARIPAELNDEPEIFNRDGAEYARYTLRTARAIEETYKEFCVQQAMDFEQRANNLNELILNARHAWMHHKPGCVDIAHLRVVGDWLGSQPEPGSLQYAVTVHYTSVKAV